MTHNAPTKLKFSLPVLSARMKDGQQATLMPPPAMYLESGTEIKLLVQVATPLVAKFLEEGRRNKVRIENKNSVVALPKISSSVGTVRDTNGPMNRNKNKERGVNAMLIEKVYSAIGVRIQ